MPDIYTAIASKLVGFTVVTGLIHEDLDLPVIRLHRVGGPRPIVSHDGVNPTRIERVQVDSVTTDPSTADAQQESVLQVICATANYMSDWGGLFVQNCVPLTAPRDTHDDVRNWWFCSRDYQIQYVQS